MVKVNYLLIGLMLIVSMDVSAYTLDFYSRRSTNYEPLTNVHITVYNNDTGETQDAFSDTNGLTSFTLVEGNYTVQAVKPSYVEQNVSFYLDDSSTRVAYLFQSTVSYIEVSFSDMTLNKHEWCFYVEDSNRLLGCYKENDTALLSPSHNYSAYPKLTLIDQLGLLNVGSFLTQISIFLIVGICLVVFIIAFIAIGTYLIWRKFK